MDLLPNDAVRQRTMKIVEAQLKTKKFTSHIIGGSEKGDNYIGIIYRGEFCAECDPNGCNGENCKKVHMIIKVPPQNKIRREKFFARPCFLNESLAYDDVLPTFMRFQESKRIIPDESGFHEVPPCYGTITDEFDEAIFLRDLSADGYQMYNRQNYITAEHVNLILKILGKYHAISFAIKDQCPEKLDKYKDIKDIFAARKGDKDFEYYLNYVKDRAIKLLNPEKHQNYINRINKLFEKDSFLELMLKLTDGKSSDPYSVIVHGDCWNNNILYRYDENNKVIDARLIDWQLVRYSSPVCDLMYFILLGTSKKLREKYYTSFMDTYYDSFSTFLKRLGSSPDKLFPRSAFNDELKKYGKYGFIMGCMLTPILTKPAEDVYDLDEAAESMSEGIEVKMEMVISPKQEDAYAERMTGIILDMFELGYL